MNATFRLPLMVGILVSLLGAAFVVHVRDLLTGDVAWFIYAAGGVVDGGMLYRDFVEHNFPLATLSMVPVVLLARYTGLSVNAALTSYVLALSTLSWFLCMPLARRWGGGRRLVFWVTAVLLFAFFFLPGYDFGQREHLFTVLITPYVLVAGMRAAAAPVPPALAIGAGLIGALAIGLKPHFVLVVAAVEASVFLRARRLGILIRPETIAVAMGLSAIAAHVVFVYPLYFDEIVPMARATYEGYDNEGMVLVLLAMFVFLAALVSPFGDRYGTQPLGSFRFVLAAGVAGAVAVFAVQGKGWFFHAYPAFFFVFLLGCVGLAQATLSGGGRRWTIARMSLAVLFVAILFPAISSPPSRGDFDEVEARIRESPGAFYVLSTGILPPFTLATALGRPWASRFSGLHLLPGLVKSERQENEQRYWEAYLRRGVAEDMARFRPAVVFIPPEGTDYSLPRGFSILEWLLRDPDFAAEWSHYRPAGKANAFRVYRRE